MAGKSAPEPKRMGKSYKLADMKNAAVILLVVVAMPHVLAPDEVRKKLTAASQVKKEKGRVGWGWRPRERS